MTRLRIATALLVVLAGLTFVGTAAADDPGFIDQYQEPFPTGGGNQHNNGGGGGTGGGGTSLPSSTLSNLQGSVSGPVATALESVATSDKLGAPQKFLDDPQAVGTGSAAEPGSAFSGVVGAAADGGSSRLLAVIVALAALTLAGALAAAVARRRYAGRPPT